MLETSNSLIKNLLPHISSVIHEGKEVIVDPNQLVVLALHIRHLHVVGGRADVLQLFAWKSII